MPDEINQEVYFKIIENIILKFQKIIVLSFK